MAEVATPLHSPLQSITASVELELELGHQIEEQNDTKTTEQKSMKNAKINSQIEETEDNNEEEEEESENHSDDTNNEAEIVHNDDVIVDEEEEEEKINKNNNKNENENIILDIEYGHCSKQGIRATMEDTVVIESKLTVPHSKCTSGFLSLYAVFDGHGGTQCAEFCAANLVSILCKYLLTETDVARAFTLCISEMDDKAIAYAKDASGSTCCIVLIDVKNFDLWCCNVGDSRCILMNSACTQNKQISVEHKPNFPMERQRIESANGWVTFGRVCGILAVSRSLGDKDFKFEIENLIVSTPDVTHRKLVRDEDKYIVLACDGLFDVFSNEQCTKWLCQKCIDEEMNDMQAMTDKLCNDAIYVRKSKDNVSVLILCINYKQQQNEQNEQDDDDEEEKISPKKHKFHVVMESDDNI